MTTKAVSSARVPILTGCQMQCVGLPICVGRTHHGPIDLLQIGLAVKAKINARYEAAENLEQNGDIVYPDPEVEIESGVAQKRMI